MNYEGGGWTPHIDLGPPWAPQSHKAGAATAYNNNTTTLGLHVVCTLDGQCWPTIVVQFKICANSARGN